MKYLLKMTGVFLMFLFLLTSCATMFRTNQATVSAASGSNQQVQVLENGLQIYSGPLPAEFPVRSGRTYTVQYRLPNGTTNVVTIAQKFNFWFIGSIASLVLLPVVIDLATGSVMTFERSTVLPINYSPMVIIGENFPFHENLMTIGNLNY